MEDAFYLKLRAHVERHLSKSPNWAIIHALIFTIISVPLGLWGLSANPVSIDGVAYWVIFLWSMALFSHVTYTYLNSGAWGRKRETGIQTEILDAGETYDLDQEEMMALHLQLRDDIQKRSQPFTRLIINAVGNIALWPGVMVVALLLFRTGVMSGNDFSSVFRSAIFLSILGTFLFGFVIPLRQLWQPKSDDNHELRAIYGYQRKRKGIPNDDHAAHLSEREDDDELILTEEEAKLRRSL